MKPVERGSDCLELDILPVNRQTGTQILAGLREDATVRGLHSTWSPPKLAIGSLILEASPLRARSPSRVLNGCLGIEPGAAGICERPAINKLAAYLKHRGSYMEMRNLLASDSVLSPEISPNGDARPTRLSRASSVLVTGATGFLGAFLLDGLLRATGRDTRFYCLVRDRASGQGRRVLETLKFYGLSSPSPEGRVVPVVGDVSRPRMGLDGGEYQELAEEIDLIFHCAASVDYSLPYDVAKPHTVDGTTETLRFACTGRTKTVQYISSNGVFPGGDDTPYLEDKWIEGFIDRMEGGYNQAKWVAERLVWSAVSRGLPVCIYRPGNIGHQSRTGTVNPNDFQSQIMRACARSGCAPLAPDWRFEMTPVDFLVSAIAKFSDEPAHLGKVYNVVQQDPVTAESVFTHMQNHGYVTGRVSLDEWKSRLREMAEGGDDPDSGTVVRSLSSVEGYLSDTSSYDISRFSRALTEIGMTMPTVDVDYVARCLI